MSKEEVKNQDEIVISLDSLGVPIAIVVAGIIIAGGIFFMNKGNSKVDDSANDNTNVEGENTTTGDSDVLSQYAQYITDGKSISIDDDPYLGDKSTAKYAIVEFSDYQCGYCGRHTTQVLPTILEKKVYTGEIIYVFRDYQMFGEISETTAMVGEYIADKSMEKFLEFHEAAYSVESVSAVYKIATDLGYNEDTIKAYVAKSSSQDEIKKDFSEGQTIGITGTPAFVVGVLGDDGMVTGRLVSGALPYEAFEAVLGDL